MTKYEPKHRDLEVTHHLEGQPARDHQALILPLSVIKITGNIRTVVSDIEDLAASIKANGLLQPLLVRKENDVFTLIAGHRRYQALKLIGAKEAPVRIQNVDDNTVQVMRLIENIQRQDLTGAEEIIAIYKLLSVFGNSQTDLAKAIGRSKSYVSHCIKVIEVIGFEKVSTSKLSKSVLFELAYKSSGSECVGDISSESKITVKNIRASEGRKPSGPVSGGRYVDQVIEFSELSKSGAFSLRVNYSPEQTPADSKVKIVKVLSAVLDRLRS